MFLETCKKLNFPQESLTALEHAYHAILSDSESAQTFRIACGSLLKPDRNVFGEATAEIAEITGVHPFTLNIVLQVCCVEPLRQIYIAHNFSEPFFWSLILDLRKQLLECKQQHNLWGNCYGLWQWAFHEWQCVKLGRLAFEPMPHFCDIAYNGIKQGDPTVLIHIPKGEPLNIDAVMDSLKQGYAYFKDRFPNGVIPFVTHTWLLYPPYMDGVFPKEGNIQKFAALFHILSQKVDNTYENFPAVFGCSYEDADFSKLPQKTTLQKNLLAYLKQGKPMGTAYGIFFYGRDGIVD